MYKTLKSFLNRSCFSIYNSITSIWMKSKFTLLKDLCKLTKIYFNIYVSLHWVFCRILCSSVTRGNLDTHIFLFQSMYYPIFWWIISYFQNKYSKYIHLFRAKHVKNSKYVGLCYVFLSSFDFYYKISCVKDADFSL
jgi:hypothetical protein